MIDYGPGQPGLLLDTIEQSVYIGAMPRPKVDHPTPWKRGYDGTWRELSTLKLLRDPLCEHCEKLGWTTPATEVDHIEPFDGLGDPRRLDWGNLRSMCKSCHSRKTSGAAAPIGEDGYPVE